MERIEKRAAKVAFSDKTPKAAAAVVLSGSLLGGADNVQAVSLTAATLAVAEMARSRFGVKGLRSSDTRSSENKIGGRLGSVASRTP
ncbi:MAG: hypothetical protein KDB52_10985 [Solirubrobacterales bacterium]|nr:hypothetical protein [Solirubrobacterales bacterium]